MDLNDLQLALPSTSSTNNDSNVKYTFASPRPQNFSLPYPIMKYIFTNPSSGKAWKKLIQTCKYFFSKNPIYPVERLHSVYENKWSADGEIIDSLKNVTNLWIYDNIDVYSDAPTILSSLIPKIYKCDLRSLDILDQDLTFDEYEFLTSSGSLEKLRLYSCTISHPDGTLVSFDRLFENVLQLKSFEMFCGENYSSMFKKDTFKKFAKILPRLKDFSEFYLFWLTEEFDFASITDFLLKNETLNIKMTYDSDVVLSDEYMKDLENFLYKIIETPPKQIPVFEFNGLEESIFNYEYQELLKW